MLTRGVWAYRVHLEPQWMRLPNQAQVDAAGTMRGRAAERSKRSLVEKGVGSPGGVRSK